MSIRSKNEERLKKEVGTVYKSHAGRIRFALAFPNVYYVGMSNLGFHTVYGELNNRDDVVCERVFLPDRDDLEDFELSGTPLTTMESGSIVSDFDVFAFSLSYELDYPNLLKMLRLSGIPLDSNAREKGPLVIAGGPAATFNPEPMAQFVDAFVLGEAETVLPDLLDVLTANLGKCRDDLLRELAQVAGVYVPRFDTPEYKDDGTIKQILVSPGIPKRIQRRRVDVLDEYPGTSVILTPETEFSNMILAEVARGCGRQCRFCAAGYTYLPPRSRSPQAVLAGIRRMDEKVSEKGLEPPRIGLLSASVFDHSSSCLICESLAESERLFSISSTRADTLTADVVNALRRGGHETLTIAPEAGTDRLRMAINKVITDEEVYTAAETAWTGGFRRLKLYYMVGLPTETDYDIDGVIDNVQEISNKFRWKRLSVSVSCFVPKPWTPFQWVGMNDEKLLAEKQNRIVKALRSIRSVEVSGESPRESVVQGVLARGDRRVGDALRVYAEGKVSWKASFRQAEIDPSFYTQRIRDVDEVFPWDHLDLGVKKTYLWTEYQRALQCATTNACQVGSCRRCGVCG